ncbi:hypothetical protein J6590_097378 [Homalodisca vitripennis]|nr:hypothetical protein J6590_097378 [Homalodisca vitripennis]
MSAQCFKCKQLINDAEVAKCCACEMCYHASCIKGGDRKFQRLRDKTAWRCDACKDDAASMTGSESGEDKGAILKAIAALSAKMDTKFSDMQSSISELKSDFCQLSESLDSVKAENVALKQECALLKAINNEIKLDVSQLNSKIHELEQYSRNDNLEITGVPVARVLSVPFHDGDIAIAHRLQSSKRTLYPSIVAKFVSRRTRDVWLTAARAVKRWICASNIHQKFKPSAIYINEHLTVYMKALLAQCRAQVKEGRLAYAWVSNNKLLVRKVDGAPAVRISGHSDLDKLLASE